MKHERTLTFIDLFAGIGGFRLAFEAVGGTCVLTSEIDRHAQDTYIANFGPDGVVGDIREIDAISVPKHDILLAGFPCQPFSAAGVSKYNSLNRPHGFEDERQGNLFFEIVRLLDTCQPPAFLLENVRNLMSHDKGRTIATILRLLDECGYDVKAPKLLNARSVVPQGRVRTFIAGFRRDLLEEGETAESLFDWPTEFPPTPTLQDILDDNQTVPLKYTISDHLWQYFRDYAASHRRRGNGFGYGIVKHSDPYTRTLSARYYKDGAEILIDQSDIGKNPRRLTPDEAARLMGYDPEHLRKIVKAKPVDGVEHIHIVPVSDTRAYRLLGNSVVVPLVTAIAHEMAPAIGMLAQRRDELAEQGIDLPPRQVKVVRQHEVQAPLKLALSA